MDISYRVMCGLMVVIATVVMVTGQSSPATTPLTPEQDCALGAGDCGSCLDRGVKCLYCAVNKTCVPYPSGSVLPSSSVCPLSQAKWGVCWVNYEVLLITMGVLAGILLITLITCCYCCCCRNSKEKAERRYMKEERKLESEREQRQQRHAERRQERSSRLDEIRRKYGLIKDDQQPYERFDA